MADDTIGSGSAGNGDVKLTPWPPAQATKNIQKYGANPKLRYAQTDHAKQRLAERGLINSDVLYVLRTGFVYEEGEPATQAGFFKYKIQGTSPNSGGRSLRVVVIPSPCRIEIKIVTVMWVDEQ